MDPSSRHAESIKCLHHYTIGYILGNANNVTPTAILRVPFLLARALLKKEITIYQNICIFKDNARCGITSKKMGARGGQTLFLSFTVLWQEYAMLPSNFHQRYFLD
jgi:hypothetical protein